MKRNRRSRPILWLCTLLLGAIACGGGGGGGGESFIVSGLWGVAATSTPGTPSPSDDSPAGVVCNAAAAGAGPLPGAQINVAQQDGTLTATGGGLEYTGSVNDANQSFTLNSTTPICQQQGACVVCGVASLDFLDAAGNTANVNVAFGFNGNAACPFQCTVTFTEVPATRS